jgi:hypothetical protein
VSPHVDRASSEVVVFRRLVRHPPHKNSFFAGMTFDEVRRWKQEQQDKGLYPMVAQPCHETIVRLGPRREDRRVRTGCLEPVV